MNVAGEVAAAGERCEERVLVGCWSCPICPPDCWRLYLYPSARSDDVALTQPGDAIATLTPL